jgi:hypothetical protein
MLGRIRRTTRTDVGLALSFAGIAYLVWVFVAGVSRDVVQELIKSATVRRLILPDSARWVKVVFVEGGIFIDVAGLAWLAASLFLVMWSSRQRCSISWAWVSATCQAIVAALGAVLVGWAAYQPHVIRINAAVPGSPTWQKVSEISLPVIAAIAVVLWSVVLVWLLVERARLNRRGPTLRDGLRTNISR